MDMAVQIQVSDEVWKLLLLKKEKPSDTFNEIIKRAIETQTHGGEKK